MNINRIKNQIEQKEQTQIRLVKVVVVLTNQSGAVVEQTFYEPFGGIIAGGNLSRYDYEGREFSSLTEDYDFRFRKYDPQLKIFTQPDGGVKNVYDPQTLNRYTFERNNPYKYTDPNGKYAQLALALVGAYIGLVYYDYQVHYGGVEYSWKGQLGYAIAGAGSVLIPELIIAQGGGGLLYYATGTSAGSLFSTIVENVATGRPATEGAGVDVIFSIVTGPIGKISKKNTIWQLLGILGFQEVTKQTGINRYNSYFSQTQSSYSYQLDQASDGGGISCDQYGCYSTASPGSYSGGSGSGGGGSGGSCSIGSGRSGNNNGNAENDLEKVIPDNPLNQFIKK